MKGLLIVKGLTTLSRVGCLPTEQKVPQPIEVDLELELELGRAAAEDSLRDALDYRRVCDLTRSLLENNSYRLLEAAAFAIAKEVLACFPQVQRVKLQIRKPHPAIPVPLHFAAVSLDLTRQDIVSP
ncbi:MAG: dihydroneopterin aldolase [Armatimonadetes bacterium]|nr:dihydroneopterin aldolase [Armatimonadota bacterium]MDW8122262.1 dihydroneopterin aldolase [Armatimonadota bacterium]